MYNRQPRKAISLVIDEPDRDEDKKNEEDEESEEEDVEDIDAVFDKLLTIRKNAI